MEGKSTRLLRGLGMERRSALPSLATRLRQPFPMAMANEGAMIFQAGAKRLRRLTRSRPLWILAFKRHSERVQFRRHQSAPDRGIGLHERARGGLIGRLEDRNAERLVTWLARASSEDQLTRFCGFL